MLWFDEADYLTRHPDVRAAIEAGVVPSGRWHFRNYGCVEGRAARRRWTPGRRRYGVATIVRPQSHWSGVSLVCWRTGEAPGRLLVTVERLTGSGRVLERRAELPLTAIDSANPVTLNWAPVGDAARALFRLHVRQVTPDGRPHPAPPLRLALGQHDVAFVYSPPDAALPLPEAILFSPVSQCNLNCIHCISRHSRRTTAELHERHWDQIVAGVAQGHIKILRTDYSGDLFFADRRYGGWVDRIVSLGIPFAIDTHGNDLDAPTTDRLLRSRVYAIGFSLDTFDADDYPRIRRGACPLPEVLDRTRAFMVARHARRPDLHVYLSFVLMRRNLDTLAQAIDFAAANGIPTIMANHLHVWTPDMIEESLLLDPGRYERAYAALTARAVARGVQVALPVPIRATVARRAHHPCTYPWKALTILGTGDVMACCVPGTRVGHLGEASLAEIWHGEPLRRFRSQVNGDQPPDSCAVCPMTRTSNNFASYVPGLSEPERQRFEGRCIAALQAAAAR